MPGIYRQLQHIKMHQRSLDSLNEGSKITKEKIKDKYLKALTKYIKILFFTIKKQWAVSHNFLSLVKFIGEDLEDFWNHVIRMPHIYQINQ